MSVPVFFCNRLVAFCSLQFFSFCMNSPSCHGFASLIVEGACRGYRNYIVFFVICLGTASHVYIDILKKLFNKYINLSYYEHLLAELLFCNFVYKILMQI